MTPKEQIAEIHRILDGANFADKTASGKVIHNMNAVQRVAWGLELLRAVQLQRNEAIRIWDESARAFEALKAKK